MFFTGALNGAVIAVAVCVADCLGPQARSRHATTKLI